MRKKLVEFVILEMNSRVYPVIRKGDENKTNVLFLQHHSGSQRREPETIR